MASDGYCWNTMFDNPNFKPEYSVNSKGEKIPVAYAAARIGCNCQRCVDKFGIDDVMSLKKYHMTAVEGAKVNESVTQIEIIKKLEDLNKKMADLKKKTKEDVMKKLEEFEQKASGLEGEINEIKQRVYTITPAITLKTTQPKDTTASSKPPINKPTKPTTKPAAKPSTGKQKPGGIVETFLSGITSNMGDVVDDPFNYPPPDITPPGSQRPLVRGSGANKGGQEFDVFDASTY